MQSFRFHPVVWRWFEEKFGSPTEPQQRGWPAIQSGANTLIAAPTGSGKTLAAFLAALDALFREGLSGTLTDETRVLYVSPLKALSNDIHKNLEEPLSGIRAALLSTEGREVEVRAAVRTGDTPAAKRQAMTRKPPHILVTTPESFYLLLTSESGRKLLRPVRTVIVDEIHAVVGNRRGAHLALSLERLEALVGTSVQRIGLSATQKPLAEVARFLVGVRQPPRSSTAAQSLVDSSAGDLEQEKRDGPGGMADKPAPCTVVDFGYSRKLDLAIELPGSPLEAVMSNEVWLEIYNRVAELIEQHRTTLVFVNTRRLAERVTHHLSERLGSDKITSHHGSLSARLRLEAEHRLKKGELKALVATASLELGIDIGSVDLVCQIGPTRSIATLLQRVGRAQHQRGGVPKGRIFPLSRDELVECVATLRCVKRGELDLLRIPEKPLDVLAQQIVACAAAEDWQGQALFDLVRRAYPYRELTRGEFDEVLRMLAEGFSTRRGRRGALIHYDAVQDRVRARRGARLVALTSGGAIADNADYRVLLEPDETFLGTVNEDFAVESLAGDIFQLGNASWRILRINSGTVRVQDAQGQPPNIPFWLGEAPGRTAEVSQAVSDLRQQAQNQMASEAATDPNDLAWFDADNVLPESGKRQLADYFAASYKTLGVIPSQQQLVLERFFDESGGMQLVIHSPYGIRINRAWGLALRKRFCRSFNFELQAAATEEAIVLSLGTQHSFPLEEVFRYLNSQTVRDLLIQALLDAPMFPIHWRWNAMRALALPRQRGGRRVPPPLQRMEAENLLAAVFPDQLACLENIVGDRQVPDHPLVRQTIQDCLTEAMDIDGLIAVLERIEQGQVQCLARDLPEPSVLADEILNARPYAFLDNAPLEERRTQAVYRRRAAESNTDSELGILDGAAISKVCAEAWPTAVNADELHDALLLTEALTEEEVVRTAPAPGPLLELLTREKRAGMLSPEPPPSPASAGPGPVRFWVAAERLPILKAIYPQSEVQPELTVPEFEAKRTWEFGDALRELVRGRMEVCGPTTVSALAGLFQLRDSQIEAALLALEAEGFILRGKFQAGNEQLQWCDRRLLARIHRLTLSQLRAEIQPVSIAEFQRFLMAWQRVDAEHQVEGVAGLQTVLELLDAYELSAAAWEPEILAVRVKQYHPQTLDQLCFTGRFGWGRLSGKPNGRSTGPVRSSPITVFARENLAHWLALSPAAAELNLVPDTGRVLEALRQGGALFFAELVKRTGLLATRVEQALAELVTLGGVTSDSFEGLRALLLPQEKRAAYGDLGRKRHHKAVTSLENAGRWWLLAAGNGSRNGQDAPPVPASGLSMPETKEREAAIEILARVLLQRYGVVFRRLLEREPFQVSWYELGRIYRRSEARGEIRGGHFVGGVSGEQFALPEAIGLLRSIRKAPATGELTVISAADPLNLVGILTPGRRVTAIAANRILLRDGLPIAALEGGQITRLERSADELNGAVERALTIGRMSVALRPYYA